MHRPTTEGLRHKYNVTKADDGTPVPDCFVLRPDRDPHAAVALKAYADSIRRDNPTFAEQLDAQIKLMATEMEEAGREAFHEDRYYNQDELRDWDDLTSVERDLWRIQGMRKRKP